MRNYKSKTFNYAQDFKSVDFKKNPRLYQVGIGEQGVLLVEPYKSEILPHWRFKTVPIATRSAKQIFALFKEYKKNKDLVGMDMARKFLQMGYTRARRYANHASGKKYKQNPQLEGSPSKEKKARKNVLPLEQDSLTNEKAQAARVFYSYYLKANTDAYYMAQKTEHKKKFG